MPTVLTLQAAKFWVALVGTILSAVVASWPDAPRWVGIALAVCTAVSVYLVPNKQLPADPAVDGVEVDPGIEP